MRISTFAFSAIALAALTAAPSFAGNLKEQPKNATSQELSRIRGNKPVGKVSGPQLDLKAAAENTRRASKKIRMSSEDIITNPEGAESIYSRSGNSYISFWGSIYSSSQNGQVFYMTTAADDTTVYLQDPVSGAATGNYVKGTLENGEISVPTGQTLYYWDEDGYGLELYVGKAEVDDEGSLTYVIDDTVTEIKYTIGEDGVISLDPSFTEGEDGYPEKVVGAFYSKVMPEEYEDYAGSWGGYADWNSVYTPVTETIALFPDGAEIEDWVMKYGFDGSTSYTNVKVAVKDGKVYLGGLNQNSPEAVLVGELDGTKVSFPSNQYMGIYSLYLSYALGATYTIETEEYDFGDGDIYTYETTVYAKADSFDMEYDAEAKTLTSTVEVTDTAGSALLLNAGKVEEDADIYTISSYGNPEIFFFTEVEAVPATPEITYYQDTLDDYGYNGFQCTIPSQDVDGNYISGDKMKFIVWFKTDGEEEMFTFYADEYVGLDALGVDELVEFPYNGVIYDADDYIDVDNSMVILYVSSPDEVGLQSVYYGADIRHESDIFWYNCETGETHVSAAGVNTVSTDKAEIKSVFGIDGLRHNGLQKGLNVIRMSDGSARIVLVK